MLNMKATVDYTTFENDDNKDIAEVEHTFREFQLHFEGGLKVKMTPEQFENLCLKMKKKHEELF